MNGSREYRRQEIRLSRSDREGWERAIGPRFRVALQMRLWGLPHGLLAFAQRGKGQILRMPLEAEFRNDADLRGLPGGKAALGVCQGQLRRRSRCVLPDLQEPEEPCALSRRSGADIEAPEKAALRVAVRSDRRIWRKMHVLRGEGAYFPRNRSQKQRRVRASQDGRSQRHVLSVAA